jgi:DNA-3-methyladenine glycosylase I
VPVQDDQALFEKLLLDGFQAGLSWLIVLKKRDEIRRSFDGFDPEQLARYGDRERARLLADPRIIRNRAKIAAATTNARAYLRLREAGVGFATHLWSFVDGATVQHHVRSLGRIPTESRASRAMSRDLSARGFRFVGPTILYAFMQAVGMVNDHLVRCFRYPELGASRRPKSSRRSG